MNLFDNSTVSTTKNQSLPWSAESTQRIRWRLDLRLLIAVLSALAYHGTLSISGTYRSTYDAYVHIFFADHWRRTWFDHWDPRWYTGFTLTSYPPLSQQSVALLSNLTDDLELAFALVQTMSMVVMTIGMYRFAQLWVDKESAGWAAMWLVFSSAMAETVHVFGQLPTTFSLGLLLNALPFTYAWIVEGRPSSLAKSWALTAATTGAHHVTTLFGSVFITAPVIVLALVTHLRRPLSDEPTQSPLYVTRENWRALVMRRIRRMMPAILRSGLFGVGTIFLLILVVFPYWAWSRSDPITQVPIPHASRDNFLVNLSAGLVFWLIPYGLLLFTFPYVLYKGFTTKAWPLASSISLLALLGTGGTTPIPRLLLRHAFEILTLDRFTLWASILMLPLAGRFMVSLINGNLARWLSEQFGPITQKASVIFLIGGLLCASTLTVNLTQFRRFQPASIDMQPIVTFLHKDQHWRWRYMTLGFGDQMAWLSAQTTAVQVDGNYHSARRLPEMTTTPVERLEGAKFRGIPGIGSLQQFLAVPDKYNLKYIFSNDQFYDPLLYFYGWNRIQRLENYIVVWEKEDIPVLPEVLPRKEVPLYHRIMFGILPVLALSTAAIVLSAHLWSIPFRLLSEVLGIRIHKRWFAPFVMVAKPFRRKWQQLDNWFLEASYLPGNGEQAEIHSEWQVRFKKLLERLSKPPSVSARQVRVGLLTLIILVAGGTSIRRVYQINNTPEKTIWAYYDDLDFRRFESAYQRLNPNERPAFDEYMLMLSVNGGLVASYSKLESLETTLIEGNENSKTYQVDVRYITALSYYTDTVSLKLESDPVAGWTIAPPTFDIKVPPDQFLRRPGINWLSQGRRKVTSGTTNFTDVLDRPELEILSARLVRNSEGRYAVVGEVYNRDVDPADITVTALLYDDEDELLTWYNAGEAMIHKLLPLEITPFRINFEGVAGLPLTDEPEEDPHSHSSEHAESDEHSTSSMDDAEVTLIDKYGVEDLSFSPDMEWHYVPQSDVQIDRFDVYAKAVVTKQDLYRGLGTQNIIVTEAPAITVTEASNFTVTEASNFTVTEASNFTVTEASNFTVTEASNFTVTEAPDISVVEVPDITVTEAPDITVVEVPDITVTEAPDITVVEVPDITVTEAPDITVTEALNFTVAEASNFTVAEVSDITVAEVSDISVVEVSGKSIISGTLINSGLQEAVIPHLLFTLYDENGDAIWVEDVFVREAVRAQRTLDFVVTLPGRDEFEVLNVRSDQFSNSLSDVKSLRGQRGDFIPMPASSGFHYVRINVHAFLGGAG